MLGVLLLLPLYFTQELPKSQLLTFLVAPPPPPPPPPAAQQVAKIMKQIESDLLSGGQLRSAHQDSRESANDQRRSSSAAAGGGVLAAYRAEFRWPSRGVIGVLSTLLQPFVHTQVATGGAPADPHLAGDNQWFAAAQSGNHLTQ